MAPGACTDVAVSFGGKKDEAAHRALFDFHFPEQEQLPRKFEISFCSTSKDGRRAIRLLRDGAQIGDVLTDNAREDDGYRFHDIFHFSHAAVLGWSPMARTLLNCKRKSNPDIDMVEDGARAKILEEAVCALVFDYARENNFLANLDRVDRSILRTIASLTADREVSACTEDDWESAIRQGFAVWREMRANNGGILEGDLLQRRISYRAAN